MNEPSLYLTFKPAEESQRELIHHWLEQDYIREWVHGQGLKNLLTGLEKFFRYRSEGKGLERTAELTQHWIGYDGNKPFVYLLTSNVFKNADDVYAKHCDAEGLAITLDVFLCDPTYLGRGLADSIIKEFLLNQFSDVSEIFIDPEQSNKKAVHVYQKVGFRIIDEFIATWHPVPHYLMKLQMKDIAE